MFVKEQGLLMTEPYEDAAGSGASTGLEERLPHRRDREREQRRADILRRALQFFSQKGYEGTTMAEIAAASQFAVGTLYKFFRDKRDLYQALLIDTVRDYESKMVKALEGPGDEHARLCRMIDVTSELFVRHLPMSRVYFSQSSASFLFASAGLEDETLLTYRRISSAIADVFRSGVARGIFVDIDPVVLALGLEGVINGFLAALVRDPNAYTPKQIADLTKKMFFEKTLKQ